MVGIGQIELIPAHHVTTGMFHSKDLPSAQTKTLREPGRANDVVRDDPAVTAAHGAELFEPTDTPLAGSVHFATD